MTTRNLILLVGGVVLLSATVGLGSRWVGDRFGFPVGAGATTPAASVTEPRDFRYVSLEKILVMLRGSEGGAPDHYLLLDQVFKVPVKDERMLRDHLPRLRSVAVRALSTYTMADAGRLGIDELNGVLGKAYRDDYAASNEAPPFTDTMIGKFVLE